MSPRHRALLIAVLSVVAALTPAAAEARDLLSTSVSAPRNEDRSCTTRLLGGAAQPAKTLTAPAAGGSRRGSGATAPATGTSRSSRPRPAAALPARPHGAPRRRQDDHDLTVRRAGAKTTTSTLTTRKL